MLYALERARGQEAGEQGGERLLTLAGQMYVLFATTHHSSHQHDILLTFRGHLVLGFAPLIGNFLFETGHKNGMTLINFR